MLLESGKWFMAFEDAFVIFLDTIGCLDSVLKIAISRWSEQLPRGRLMLIFLG